jgi:hypothetical protein
MKTVQNQVRLPYLAFELLIQCKKTVYHQYEAQESKPFIYRRNKKN